MRALTDRTGPLARAAIAALLVRRARDVPERPPILVGGLGGSGSRALVGVLERGGVAMGRWNNSATLDSTPLSFVNGRWFRRVFASPEGLPRRAVGEVRRAAELHRQGTGPPDERWGWKHNASALMLALHAAAYPGLQFIHIVRDGRDMAVGHPHWLMQRHRRFLGLDPSDTLAAHLQLWALNHNRAADDAETYCPGRHLEVRYEDLCCRPAETIAGIYAFVGVPTDGAGDAAALVRPSQRIGRWRAREAEIGRRADEDFWAAMRRFGYT